MKNEIQNAYRKLARKHDPDVNPGNKSGEEKFKEINEAYQVLSDSEKRRRYDQLGENWKAGSDFTPSPRPDCGFPGGTRVEYGDPGDIFGDGHSDFFEALFGRGLRNARPRYRGRNRCHASGGASRCAADLQYRNYREVPHLQRFRDQGQ